MKLFTKLFSNKKVLWSSGINCHPFPLPESRADSTRPEHYFASAAFPRFKIVPQRVFVQQHVFEADFWAKFGTLNSICVASKRLLEPKFQPDGV